MGIHAHVVQRHTLACVLEAHDGVHQIQHINIRFGLGTVAQNPQMGGIVLQPLDEVEDDAVGQPGTDYVGESEHQHLQIVHVGVGGDGGLGAQLAAAVVGDGAQRHGVLRHLAAHLLTVDGGSGRKEQFLHTIEPHGLQQ